jgi:hypothetical protein
MLTDKERKAIMKSDPSTYFGHTHDESGGRFQKQVPINKSGKDPATLYPRLPASSPSAQPDPSGKEPSLGFSVDETPIVGEQWEIEKSLDQQFGLQRSLRDGAPSGSVSSLADPPKPAPDAEVIRERDVENPPRHSLPASGRRSTNQRVGEGRVSPNNIKRRLV